MIRKKSFHKRIFNIRRLISNIVCCFQNIGQRMALSVRSGGLSNLLIKFLICIVISKLFILDISCCRIDFQRRYRIFHDCPKQGIRQIHPILIHKIVQLTDKSERLCISFKMVKIFSHLVIQHLLNTLSTKCHNWKVPLKPITDHCLTKMSKWRVPNIMNQTRTL